MLRRPIFRIKRPTRFSMLVFSPIFGVSTTIDFTIVVVHSAERSGYSVLPTTGPDLGKCSTFCAKLPLHDYPLKGTSLAESKTAWFISRYHRKQQEIEVPSDPS